jgi:hypothetical protein
VPEEGVEPSRPEGHGILSDHGRWAPSTIIGDHRQQLPAQVGFSAASTGSRPYRFFHLSVDGSRKVPAKWRRGFKVRRAGVVQATFPAMRPHEPQERRTIRGTRASALKTTSLTRFQSAASVTGPTCSSAARPTRTAPPESPARIRACCSADRDGIPSVHRPRRASRRPPHRDRRRFQPRAAARDRSVR